MNLYTVTFTRNDSGIKQETILAENEQQARNIFADCEVLRVELKQENYDQELESQMNAARIWTSNMHVTEADADALHDHLEALDNGDWLSDAGPKLPPAEISTLQELADAQERSFNRRYYGNAEGKAEWSYRR